MCEHMCLSDKSSDYFENTNDGLLDDYSCDYFLGLDDTDEEERSRCKCRRECKDECLKLNFDYYFYEVNDPWVAQQLKNHSMKLNFDFSFFEVNDPWVAHHLKSKTAATVSLFIANPNVRVFSYKPQYEDVELFSYVGGFLGCWLGISLWSSTGILWKGYSSLVTMVVDQREKRKSLKKNNSSF